MAEVIGQSEALKKLILELHKQDILNINSTAQINEFLSDYEAKKADLLQSVENDVKKEIKSLESEIINHQVIFNDDIRLKREKQIELYNFLISKRRRLKKLVFKTRFARFIRRLRINLLGLRIFHLRRGSINKIHNSTKRLNRKLFRIEAEYYDLSNKEDEIIEYRTSSKTKELDHIKSVLNNLGPQIAGAIGEQLVVKELEKLSNDYTIISDFNLKFDPPIYIKKTNDRVFSVQIDHIVISKAGVFLIETKNWSKDSVNSFDLRSPVEQIVRNGSALFLKMRDDINTGKLSLEKHHWGTKKIPIRNLIVMINNKPEGEFDFVRIKLLRELNGYIKYFSSELSVEEYGRVKSYFVDLMD